MSAPSIRDAQAWTELNPNTAKKHKNDTKLRLMPKTEPELKLRNRKPVTATVTCPDLLVWIVISSAFDVRCDNPNKFPSTGLLSEKNW